MFKALLVAAVVLVATPAGANEPPSSDTREAAQLFRAGQAAYERGDHEAAARAFDEAYRRAPRAGAAYNAGRGWQAAHSPARAADSFARALRDDVSYADLRPEQRAHAQSALEALRGEVAELTISEPAGARVDVGYVEGRTVPTTIYLVPGRHTLRLSSGTREAFREVTVTGGERQTLTLTLPPPPVSAPPAEPPAIRAPRALAVYGAPSVGARDPWAWVSAGVAVAAGAGAAVVGLRFLDKRNAFEESDFTNRSLHDDAVRLRTYTNVAIGTAVVFAAISAWRFLRQPNAAGKETLVLTAPNGAFVAGSF